MEVRAVNITVEYFAYEYMLLGGLSLHLNHLIP